MKSVNVIAPSELEDHYVILDYETGNLSVGSGKNTGIATIWKIHKDLSTPALKMLLQDIKPYAQQVLDGSHPEPVLVVMTKEAVRAEADISILCAEVSGYEDC